MPSYPRIIWWILAAIVLAIYILADVPIHFFKHFFMGTSVGLLFVLYQTGQQKPLTQNSWNIPFLCWLFAMFPDVLHTLGYEGHPGKWVDIFLLHNTIDTIAYIELILGIVVVLELICLRRLLPSSIKTFTPALAFHWLTPTYDIVCEWVGFGRSFKRRIVSLINPQSNQKLLDVGAGTGTFLSELLATYPDVKAFGIEPDPRILSLAKEKLAKVQASAELVEGTAGNLPFADQTFDIVTSTLVFHHLSTATKKEAMAEVYRVLKDSGRFYLIDFGKPESAIQTIALWLGSLFDGRENLWANLRGVLPQMLSETGFEVVEAAEPFRAVRFLVARKKSST